MTAGVYSVQLEVRKGDAKAFDKIDITVQAKPRINRPPVAIVKPNPVKVQSLQSRLKCYQLSGEMKCFLFFSSL